MSFALSSVYPFSFLFHRSCATGFGRYSESPDLRPGFWTICPAYDSSLFGPPAVEGGVIIRSSLDYLTQSLGSYAIGQGHPSRNLLRILRLSDHPWSADPAHRAPQVLSVGRVCGPSRSHGSFYPLNLIFKISHEDQGG